MKKALVIALVVLAATVVAQLAHGSTRLAGSNRTEPAGFVVTSRGPSRICQLGEELYARTATIRMTVGTYGQPGPALDLQWLSGKRVVAHGRLARGWKQGVIHVPLAAAPERSFAPATLCVTAHADRGQRLAWAGEPADPSVGTRVNGKPAGGRLSLISELAGHPSLLSIWPLMGGRYDAGNARWLGAWTWWLIPLLVLGALAAAGAALAARNHAPAARVPRAAWLATLSAALACGAWALLTPPFHVPDEVSHVAYVQAIAESGTLPRDQGGFNPYSEQENNVLGGLGFYSVIGRADSRPPWTAPEEAVLRAAESRPAQHGVHNATTASANPPLYYLMETPVYLATPSSDVLDKLLPMRLLSVLLGAVTVLAIFLFMRELLPRSPWTWPAGALVCALQPVFGFISGGVNSDALLFACSAVTFLLIARVLRHGPAPKRLLALGAAVAAGLLSKPLFIGMIPAVAVALGIVIVRELRARSGFRRIATTALLPISIPLVAFVAYDVIGASAFDHPYFPRGSTVATVAGTTANAAGAAAGSLREEISFIWQLWLPRLPFMHDLIPGFPLHSIWLNVFLGRFGWVDYGFSSSVLLVWTISAFVIGLLALASLIRFRRDVRPRLGELAAYAAGVAGIALAIGTKQYQASITPGSPNLTQGRYLLPLLALYGGLIAVAVRLWGRRAGPYVAVAAVTIAAVHECAALLLTVARYYA